MQQQILELLRGGDAAGAVAAARDAVARDPDDPALHRLLAAALQSAGDADAAREAIELAAARFPHEADVHLAQAALLIGQRELDAAGDALSRVTLADPNAFVGHLTQAQLALARGDVDDAERVSKLSARIAPGHPWQAVVEGMVALRRGRGAEALALLSRANAQVPEDGHVLRAYGLALAANGHFAFAEQAFSTLLARSPGSPTLRGLVATLLHRQGRSTEALEVIAPLLAQAPAAAPGLRRFAGELLLAAGDPRSALDHLRAALAGQPGDPSTLALAMQAWGALGDLDDARNSLDAALATAPGASALWAARLSLEDPGAAAVPALLARWLAASPDDPAALEAGMRVLALRNDRAAAESFAERLAARMPGHIAAQWRVFDALSRRDAAAAAERVRGLLEQTPSVEGRRLLQSWLGLAQDRAGDVDAAVASWRALDLEAAPQRLAPWPPTSGALPAAVDPADAEAAAPVVFLHGLPGSQVERLGVVLAATVPTFRGDRFGNGAPEDALQDAATGTRIVEGSLAAADVAGQWRSGLAARGVGHGDALVEWLPWWDNALIAVVQAGIGNAEVAFAIRDPRDMLLAWLAWPAPVPLRFADPVVAADWLAASLDQLERFASAAPCPVRIVRLDALGDDPDAFASAMAEVTATDPRPLPAALPLPAATLPAGRWRAYTGPLGDAFARLADVARRLGYPER